MSSQKKDLVAGAFSLALAGIISRILGVIYIVPFQNMAKDYAMGLYQMAYSIYLVMLMTTTAGIPLAMSKMISERNAIGNYAEADLIFRVGARYLALSGLIFFMVMFLSSRIVGSLMGDPDSSTAIRALSFALLVVPLLAAMRGYVQGHHSMALSGNAQVVEQFVRVSTILIGVFVAVKLGFEPQVTAAVATFGAVLGAFVSLLFLARHVVNIRRENRNKYSPVATEKNWKVFYTILKVSVPITLTSLVLPFSQLIDGVTIVNLLMYGFDLTKEIATEEYGIFTARALRLIALPLSLAVAIGTSLMPSIAEAVKERNIKLRDERILTSFRLTSFFAFPSAVGIYVLAGPIDIALFQDLRGFDTIALVAFMSIFASYEVVCAYLLQSLGHLYLPILYMFAGLGVKLMMNLVLVPNFGIWGAAIASVSGYFLSAGLSVYAVKKVTSTPLSFQILIGKPLLASLIMGVFVWFWTWVPLETFIPWSRLANFLIVIVGGIIGLFVFTNAMVWQNGISKDELGRMPFLKRFLL